MLPELEKWASFVLANLLWSAFAIPVITIPAATAGLFSVMSQRARGQQRELFVEFFGAMRRLWRKATAVALVDLLLGGLLVFNLSIFPMMSSQDVIGIISRSVTLFVGLLLLLVNLYVWSLMVVYDMPLKQLFELSYKLVFLQPIKSIGVLLLAIIPGVISLLLPRGFFLLVTASFTALIITWGTWPIIRRYVQTDESNQFLQ